MVQNITQHLASGLSQGCIRINTELGVTNRTKDLKKYVIFRMFSFSCKRN